MRPEFEVSTTNRGTALDLAFDAVDLLLAGIADAGYAAAYSHGRFYPGRIHVYVGALDPALFDFIVAQRLRYGLVVDEPPSEDGAQIRHIEGASFVWCASAEAEAFCRTRNRRVGSIPFGFSPRLLPRFSVDWNHRDIAGLMTGELTERRAGVLRACQARGFPLQYIGYPLPSWLRDTYLARARLHVAAARADGPARAVDAPRIVLGVCHKVGLALELDPGTPADLAEFFDAAAPGALPERAAALHSDPEALRSTVERRFERFADTRAMARPFADLIAATVPG